VKGRCLTTRRSLLVLLAFSFGVRPAAAEDAPYVEYRVSRTLGQIQITTGFMDRTPELSSHLPALERQGIVVLETEKARVFARTEQMGTHRIQTTISIAPPVGHGEGGASSIVDLRIVVDSRVRVDCPLWRASFGIDRLVFEPERGFVTLDAHEGILRFDGFEPKGTVDSDWLEHRAEFVRQLITVRK
jgi:hypothetical protein